MMNTKIFGVAPALACMALLAGCGHTAEGVKQDATKDTQAVGTAADKAATATKDAAAGTVAATRNATEASILTPSVKTAIVRDPILNDPKNLINVSTANNVVSLTGHVQTAEMRKRATEDTQKAINDHHSTAKLINKLTVSGAGA